MYNCCDESVRQGHRNDVIQKYFEIFQQTLAKLNYKGNIPKLLDLQLELLRCGLLEYMFLLVIVPFQYIDLSKLDINKMMETKDLHEVTKDVFKNKEFQDNVIKRVKYLIEMGVFE